MGTKITDLTALTTPENDALIPIVEDPDGTAATRRMSISTLIPAGTIMDYAGAAAPNGYLFCNGSAISRTTYAALFTAIGTAFGVGDGSTTFNVPNTRGRVSVGLNPADADFDALGDTVGAKTANLAHTHTGPNHNHSGPSHTHSGPNHNHSGPSHTHAFSGTTSVGDRQFRANPGDGSATNDGNHQHTYSGNTGSSGTGNTGAGGTGATGASGTGNTGASGTGATGSNLSSSQSVVQPSITFNRIIKT